jgi:hypothetical protein
LGHRHPKPSDAVSELQTHGTSSDLDAVSETITTGAPRPWYLFTVPTRRLGSAARRSFTCELYDTKTL